MENCPDLVLSYYGDLSLRTASDSFGAGNLPVISRKLMSSSQYEVIQEELFRALHQRLEGCGGGQHGHSCGPPSSGGALAICADCSSVSGLAGKCQDLSQSP